MAFAKELRATSSKVGPNLSKYIDEVKFQCRADAKSGFTQSHIHVLDFLGDKNAFKVKLEMMGLKVKKMESFMHSLLVDVSWCSDDKTGKLNASVVRKRPAGKTDSDPSTKRRKTIMSRTAPRH